MGNDKNTDLSEIYNRANHFTNCLMTLCFLFSANPKDIRIGGKPGVLLTQLLPKDDMIFRLRESILFRIECVAFHCRLLYQIEDEYRNDFRNPTIVFNRKVGVNEVTHNLMERSAMQQTFIFDDVAFHLMSMFEYLGCLIGYLFEGPQGSNLRWVKVYKMLAEESPLRNEKTNRRKKNSSSLRKSKAAISIKMHEREFVKWLEEYRASVFHYRSTRPRAKSSFNYMDISKSDIRIIATSEMEKWIGRIIPEMNGADMVITEVAYKMVVDGVERATDVVLKLQQDVKEMNERKVPFWFQSP